MNHELKPAAFNQINQAKFLMPAPPPNRFSTADTLRAQLHRCTTALRKRWWVLLLTFLLVGGPAVYYAASKPLTFRSEAIMWVSTKLNLPNAGFYPEDLTTYIYTQAHSSKAPPFNLVPSRKCVSIPLAGQGKTKCHFRRFAF